MLLNTFAVRDTKSPVCLIFAKQSTTYKTNSKMKSFISEQAKEFRRGFQVTNSTKPASRTGQRTLIVEEFKEFLDADNQLLTDFKINSADCLKELADLVYVCYQYAENLGWDLDEALDRVHKSNMTKLGEDGKPIRREDGKVLKGPNYQPPTLTDLV
jgi:predicted HAD superfamily Cof-like phosphohydrolase